MRVCPSAGRYGCLKRLGGGACNVYGGAVDGGERDQGLEPGGRRVGCACVHVSTRQAGVAGASNKGIRTLDSTCWVGPIVEPSNKTLTQEEGSRRNMQVFRAHFWGLVTMVMVGLSVNVGMCAPLGGLNPEAFKPLESGARDISESLTQLSLDGDHGLNTMNTGVSSGLHSPRSPVTPGWHPTSNAPLSAISPISPISAVPESASSRFASASQPSQATQKWLRAVKLVKKLTRQKGFKLRAQGQTNRWTLALKEEGMITSPPSRAPSPRIGGGSGANGHGEEHMDEELKDTAHS